jgi:hypothetical protein
MRCPNPPLTTTVSRILSMPIIVRILTAGTDNKSCRIAVSSIDDIHKMWPFLMLANVRLQGCALPTSTPHINDKWLPTHRSMDSSSVAIHQTRLPRRCSSLLDCQHSISHGQPAHAITVTIPSLSALQRHGGLVRLQLTMLRMKTIALGYIKWLLRC